MGELIVRARNMTAENTDLLNRAKLSWILPLCFLVVVALILWISSIFASNGVIALIAILLSGLAFYIPAIKYWISAWVLSEIRSAIFLHALVGLIFLLLPPFLFLILAALPGRTS